MSIESFIRKVCVQTAVYWGTPTPNGRGGYTYADPRQIQCRWEDMDRLMVHENGKLIHVKGEVLISEDLEMEGWLYLGSLADFDSSVNVSHPMNIDGAWQIKGLDKVPLFRSTTKFVRKVYLGFGNVKA